jgi:hypothetical protein
VSVALATAGTTQHSKLQRKGARPVGACTVTQQQQQACKGDTSHTMRPHHSVGLRRGHTLQATQQQHNLGRIWCVPPRTCHRVMSSEGRKPVMRPRAILERLLLDSQYSSQRTALQNCRDQHKNVKRTMQAPVALHSQQCPS